MAGSNNLKMKNRGNGSKATKRAVDPIRRRQPGPGRLRLNFDGNTLHGTQFYPSATSILNRAGTVIPVDCSSANTLGGGANVGFASAANGLTAATSIYADYWFTALQLHWIPHVAPGVTDGGTVVFIGYLDNPEQISALQAMTAAQLGVVVRSLRNVKSFNAWQPFTYNVPLTKRLPKFNVNLNTAYNDANVLERSTQGTVIVYYETISAAVDVGQFRGIYDLELRGMNVTQTT